MWQFVLSDWSCFFCVHQRNWFLNADDSGANNIHPETGTWIIEGKDNLIMAQTLSTCVHIETNQK